MAQKLMTSNAPEIRNDNLLQKVETNAPETSNQSVFQKVQAKLKELLESQDEAKLTIIIQPTQRKNLRISLESSTKSFDHWSIPMQ